MPAAGGIFKKFAYSLKKSRLTMIRRGMLNFKKKIG
jgi:hypothetical protein